MPAIAMTPKAGAHGELCGMMAIKAALAARGEKRSIVLVPESAHGTNPATAAPKITQMVSIRVKLRISALAAAITTGNGPVRESRASGTAAATISPAAAVVTASTVDLTRG